MTAFLTVVVPLPTGEPADLSRLVDSLLAQTSALWQLVVVAPAVAAPELPIDGRMIAVASLTTAGLAEAVGLGLSAATGEFVTVLGPNDSLASGAVAAIAAAVLDEPELDVVYTDEGASGSRPAFVKPDFSPERLRTQDYLRSVTAYRRTLVDTIGRVREGVVGAELYDLALRATRSTSHVGHVRGEQCVVGAPELRELWHPDGETVLDSTRRVLEEHLAATGGGSVQSVSLTGTHRTHRPVQGTPLVSIVIPTRGDRAVVRGVERCMVVEAVRGVVEQSTYRNFEIVVVIDDVADASVREELIDIAGDRLRFVPWSAPFSFSGKMNLGVLHAAGEFVLLLNDDVELITPGWIESLLSLAQLPGAGLVGSMLYFDDDTIQHAGHAYYKLDVTHIGLNSERGASGPFDGFLVEREVAGVTAACALIATSVFLEAGGFSTLLPGNFNDVDLCMKVHALGYQSYWTPYAELYHFESKSRDPRVAAYEIRTAWGRWEHLFYDSPLWPTDPHELFTRAV